MSRSASPAVVIIPVLLLVGAAAACKRATPRNSEIENIVPVAVEPVQLGTIRGVVSATGQVTVVPGAEVALVAPQTARIAEITKNVGDPVKSGDVLVRFEFPSLHVESIARAATVRAAELRVKNAKGIQDRVHGLIDRGAASRMEADAADREVDEAEIELAAARATQSATDTQGQNTMMRAPFEGVVSQRLHQPGDTVGTSEIDAILKILDTKQVQVTATVAASDVKRFVVGASAHAMAEGAPTPELLRVMARPDAERGSTTVAVTLAFEKPTALRPGTQVGVEIAAEQRSNVPLVPAIAVVREPNNSSAVFVARGDVAERRPITTGLVDTEHVEVVSGVKAGELIITQGLSNLRDGTTITVTPH
jgi:membrane fusion protein (multidrug efflux system)